MAPTIGGLFKNRTDGEKALAELQRASFSSAQISEVADSGEETLAPQKLANPAIDFFADHTATATDFRENLVDLGISLADALYFEDGIARGGALVTVKADDRAFEAVAILKQNGASMESEDRTPSSLPPAAFDAEAADADQIISLRAERLSIDKLRVASGTIRIRKEIITEQQTFDVVVSHEELVIERHPVSNGVAGGTIGENKIITIPLSREEVTVSKETFVTQEVNIGKREVTSIQRVSDSVRHEELIVHESDRVGTPRP